MSAFECPVVRVTIEPHPNADAIELARVGGYVSIVKKGQFKTGDLAVYIPEQAVIPDWLLRQMNFWDDLNCKGTLSSSAGNRVRAIKLRGVLSQGLLLDGVSLPLDAEVRTELAVGGPPEVFEGPDGFGSCVPVGTYKEGENVAEFLEIVKWEQPIPQHMVGKVAGGDIRATISYDFENIKKNPELFQEGMEVVMTEKIHGTLLQVGIVPPSIWEGQKWAEKCPSIATKDGEFKCIVTSKGQGAKGLMIDPSDESNLYVTAARQNQLWEKLASIYNRHNHTGIPVAVYIFGEIFGVQPTQGGPKGVQDLTYGQTTTQFRAFDIHVGDRWSGGYMSPFEFAKECQVEQIVAVPVIYAGPFSQKVLEEHTDGNTVIDGGRVKQIREGVVVKATVDTEHPKWGRRVAKSVSAAYLLRKGETTEFQ